MKKYVQVWLSYETFKELMRLLETADDAQRQNMLEAFEAETGPLIELFVAMEQAHQSNSNYDDEDE